MKKVMALDLDDVLFNFTQASIDFYNSRFGTELSMNDFIRYHLSEVINITREEELRRVRLFFEECYDEIRPFEEAKRAVPIIARNYSLVVITARPHYSHRKTLESVRMHFPEVEDVIFINNGIEKRKKSDMCMEIGTKIIVEDRLDYALDCSHEGIGVFLFDYPWNRGERNLPRNIKRVYSWDNVLKELNLF